MEECNEMFVFFEVTRAKCVHFHAFLLTNGAFSVTNRIIMVIQKDHQNKEYKHKIIKITKYSHEIQPFTSQCYM